MSTLKFTLRLYFEKLSYDDSCKKQGLPLLDVPQFLYFFLCRKVSVIFPIAFFSSACVCMSMRMCVCFFCYFL